jgi:hypothetical protein
MVPAGGQVREVDVVAVAGSPDPGKAPELPPLNGTALAVPGFGPSLPTQTDTYARLRFPVAVGGDAPVPVTPDPLGVLRFGERPPFVGVLPAGR